MSSSKTSRLPIKADVPSPSLRPSSFDILGVPVSIVNMRSLVEQLLSRAGARRLSTVYVRDVHGLMRAVESDRLMKLHRQADYVVPDGMPLTVVGRLRGYGRHIGRTPGADILDQLCAATHQTEFTHYFYGGKPGTAELMASNLALRYPGLKIVGTLTPPMREFLPESDLSSDQLTELSAIRDANPDFLWVGISTPKQELWISQAAEHLEAGIILGVGAAFDFHSGEIRRAPLWMRKIGLEWLHRLTSEPRRLWRRYLVIAPKFVICVASEELRRWIR